MKTETIIREELGKRIKERRKKLGMTQAQLCGDYMTRNMLSRIETGDANPSIDTLLFISQKLKMPPSFFLCRDAKEEAEYTKTVKIKDARRMLGTGQYKKCIDICSELPSDDDEVSFIIANAQIMTAIADFDRGELSDSLSHLDCAQTALHQTVYLYSEMQSQIKLMRLLIASLSKGALPHYSEFPSVVPVFFHKDRFLYVCALALNSDEKKHIRLKDTIPEDSIYRIHLEAKELMTECSYNDASILLQRVFEEAPDCFARYFALVDLENASRALEDFKAAYTYAQKRMELHDKYSI